MTSSPILKNILSVVSTRLALKAINFISLYFLLAYLTPEDFGSYGIFLSTLILAVTVGNLGVRNAVARNIGQDRKVDVHIGSVVISYPVLLIASSIIMFVALYMSGQIIVNIEQYLAITLAVASYLLIMLRQGIALGTKEIGLFNTLELFPRLVLLIVVIIFTQLVSQRIDDLAIYGMTIGLVITSIYCLFNTQLINLKLDKNNALALSKQGIVFCVALSLILLNTRIPLYLSNNLEGEHIAGNVYAAIRFNEIFLELATAAGLVVFSHATSSKNIENLKNLLSMAAIITIFTALIAVLVYFFGEKLISLLIGDKYSAAATYLGIIVFGLPFAAFNKMAYGILSGMGLPMVGVKVYLLAIIVNFLIAVTSYNMSTSAYMFYGLVASQAVATILFLTALLRLRGELNNE